MKKIFAIAVLVGAFYLQNPTETEAQELKIEMSKQQKKAEKKVIKIEKAKKKH